MRKYKEEILIAYLILISLWGLIASSGDPLFYSVNNYFFVSLFLLENEVFFNISSGFFVSTIFYMMIVYIPQKIKKKEIRPAINKLIEDVIRKGELVIDSLDQHAPSEHKIKKDNNYNLDSIRLACKNINPKSPIDPHGLFDCSIGQQLVDREYIAEKSRKKLYVFMLHLDEKLAHEVNKLDSSDFGKMVYHVADPRFNKIQSLELLAKGLWEYHCILESIVNIYKDTNKSYTNPRYVN